MHESHFIHYHAVVMTKLAMLVCLIMTDQIPDAKLIALAALKIADPSEREAYLLSSCAGDAALLELVRRIIASKPQTDADDDLEATVATDAPGVSIAATAEFLQLEKPKHGMVDGKYKLLRRIGEGGMGTVWAAEQREPVKRTVALKLIKKGMDSRAVLARFEAERQALALMDHPNIARIFDGGITDAGAPYFVMELVHGIPITDFCDSKRLTPHERLELFVPVCQAIQHAHHKGIIHRDIKPSNILVTLVDDRPVPKVIDFGVAKATGQALTEQSLDTGMGVVGTPQYMSPEQASMNQVDIDTRSDVYSLGVLLYELLAGSPPFKKEELAKAGYLEVLRVIREEDPPRPSTKLSTADGLPSLSASRSTDPKRLSLMLRNELDWIVMKALEKDRTRRYETANAFAVDIRRYLLGEPVQAHPPSVGYRLQKFLRRNRRPVLAASLVATALLLGCIGTGIGLVAARQEARQKELARQEEAKQRVIAEAEREEAQKQRRLAEQRLTATRQTISAVVNRIPNLLERVPLADGAQNVILNRMGELLRATSSDNEQDADFESSRSWGLMAVELRGGHQALSVGDNASAEQRYQAALKIARQVYEGTPRDRAKAAGNLATALSSLAQLQATLREPSAQVLAKEAIALREEAVKQQQAEDSLGKRRASLGNAWNRLAGILLQELNALPAEERRTAAAAALANSKTALEHLQTAIEELAGFPDEQSTALRDQAAAGTTLAKIAIVANDQPSVSNGYELAKSSFNILRQLEPERAYYQVALAEVCADYGDHLLITMKDPAAARTQYVENMLTIRTLNGDPHLKAMNVNRIMAYYRLGMAAEAQGNSAQVKRYFERAVLLADLVVRERAEELDARDNPELLLDDQVLLMLVQAWAGQAESAVAAARAIKSRFQGGDLARVTPNADGLLARAAFALAIAVDKGAFPDEAARTALRDETLQTLSQAIAAGFDDIQYLRNDPDAAAIRRLAGFEEIVKSITE